MYLEKKMLPKQNEKEKCEKKNSEESLLSQIPKCTIVILRGKYK